MALTPTVRLFLEGLSQLFGWIYTISWSLSFYPQPLLNWRRKSTTGATVDFSFFNAIGFTCYTITTSTFLYSPTIRSQYAVRHPLSPEPTTRFNDFAFGLHAIVLTYLTYTQFFPSLWGFRTQESQHVSRPVATIVAACGAMVTIVFGIVVVRNGVSNQNALDWAWIDVIYTIGDVKLIGTFTKYVPQMVMNYQRQSTTGWAIGQILFDVTGSILSLAQLVIDAGLQNDWSGIAGNPVKLGLGIISMLCDFVFIVQHYILYRKAEKSETEGKNDSNRDENAPLLQAV